MTINDLATEKRVSSKLLYNLIAYVRTYEISVDANALSDTDIKLLSLMLDILRDRRMLRQILSKLSRHDKQQLIDSSIPLLASKPEVYAYSRMKTMLEAGARIDTRTMLLECRERYHVSDNFMENIIKIRETLWNQRKYRSRKTRTPGKNNVFYEAEIKPIADG